MAYIKKDNLFKQILFSRGMALLIILAIIFVGLGLVSVISKGLDASHARKIAESEAKDLSQKQSDLSKKLSDLNTSVGQEAVLREQFPVVAPGEHVVVITGNSTDDQNGNTDESENSSIKNGFWDYLKNLFK